MYTALFLYKKVKKYLTKSQKFAAGGQWEDSEEMNYSFKLG